MRFRPEARRKAKKIEHEGHGGTEGGVLAIIVFNFLLRGAILRRIINRQTRAPSDFSPCAFVSSVFNFASRCGREPTPGDCVQSLLALLCLPSDDARSRVYPNPVCRGPALAHILLSHFGSRL